MARQKMIPGTEGAVDKELNDALEVYYKAMSKRVKASVAEVSAKTTLIDLLKKKGVDSYTDREHVPPLNVALKPGKFGVKVEKLENEVEDEAEEGEGEEK